MPSSTRFWPTVDDPPLQVILLRMDPTGWRMLVGCLLLNASSRRSVDRVWPAFFVRWPDPGALLGDFDRDPKRTMVGLARRFASLGLQWQKAERVLRFTWAWKLDPTPRRRGAIAEYPGCGPYAQESWDLFVLGIHRDFEDRVLAEWSRLTNR